MQARIQRVNHHDGVQSTYIIGPTSTYTPVDQDEAWIFEEMVGPVELVTFPVTSVLAPVASSTAGSRTGVSSVSVGPSTFGATASRGSPIRI